MIVIRNHVLKLCSTFNNNDGDYSFYNYPYVYILLHDENCGNAHDAAEFIYTHISEHGVVKNKYASKFLDWVILQKSISVADTLIIDDVCCIVTHIYDLSDDSILIILTRI